MESFCRVQVGADRGAAALRFRVAAPLLGLEQLIEQRRIGRFRLLGDAGEQYCIGYIEGFESYTTQFSLRMMASGLYDHKRTDPAFGSLFKWHLVEEIEHRTVAFDLYRHLFGDDWWHRARLCWRSQGHMLRFLNDCADLMSRVDVKRHGERCRIGPRQKLQLRLFPLGMRLRSMLPGYSPHHYVVPDGIAALSAQFTAMAESVR